jgi:hypothetical protein
MLSPKKVNPEIAIGHTEARYAGRGEPIHNDRSNCNGRDGESMLRNQGEQRYMILSSEKFE